MGTILFFSCIGLSVAAIYGFFKNKERKLFLKKEEFKQELLKLHELSIKRTAIVSGSMTSYVNWVNSNLSAELINSIFVNSKLLVLKDKFNISDKDFLEAFETVISDFQKIVAEQTLQTLNVINEKSVEEFKEMLKSESNVPKEDKA